MNDASSLLNCSLKFDSYFLVIFQTASHLWGAVKRELSNDLMFKKGESGFSGRRHKEKSKMLVSRKMKDVKKNWYPQHLVQYFFRKGEIFRVPKEAYERAAKSNTGKRRTLEARNRIRQKHIEALANGKYYRNSDTKIELKIETELRNRNIYFEKQVPLCGVAVVDFFLPQLKMIIEADGDYWHNIPERKVRDLQRDRILVANGFNVYRFWEKDIKISVKNCMDTIFAKV